MTSPYDPRGRIYTILSEEWTTFLWFFETVVIPPAFREHLVLVLGWTTGRRGYVSIAMITPNIPDGANRDHYVQIRSPSRRTVANEATVTLRKNKRFSPLVEQSYVRLDLVWEVPFAILLAMPRTGMQLMLRAVSMEKIMGFYSKWGWDQAWGQTYGSLPEHLQSLACHHDQNDLGAPESTKQGGEAGCPLVTRQSCQVLNDLVSSDTVKQDGEAEYEALAGSDSTGSWNSANRPDDQEDAQSEEGPSDCARKDMVYAGEAHCAVLARLLQEAQR